MPCTRKSSFILIFFLCLTTLIVSQDAEARRHRRHPKKQRVVINEPKLWERLGGNKVVSDMSDQWLKICLSDSRLANVFQGSVAKPEQIARWRKSLTDQICEVSEGPACAHASEKEKANLIPMSVAGEELKFLAYSENLYTVMQKMNIREREKNEVLGGMGELRLDELPDPEPTPSVAPTTVAATPTPAAVMAPLSPAVVSAPPSPAVVSAPPSPAAVSAPPTTAAKSEVDPSAAPSSEK